MLSLARGSLGIIFEGFLTGTRVVASGIGGIIELVDDDDNEILISRVRGQTIISAVRLINAEVHYEVLGNCTQHA